MTNIMEAFANVKTTENGDIAYTKVSNNNNLINLLFLSEYYQNHLGEVTEDLIGTTEKDKIFARFIRDPRYGLGRRDLGRRVMKLAQCNIEDIVKSGRADDVLAIFGLTDEVLSFLKSEIEKGNELVKKWMPRYASKNLLVARQIAKKWGMNKQTYGKFIKCNTIENTLSRNEVENIKFEHIPSLAMLKYATCFKTRDDISLKYDEYLDSVKKGTSKMNVSTATVYDIYKNASKIDADIVFDQMEKISISCMPIVDTSGSMYDRNDSIGKALSIGHYLGKCSTYLNNHVVTFSSHPHIIELGNEKYKHICYHTDDRPIGDRTSNYSKEIGSMITGDCSNTDLAKVMELLLDTDELPEFLVILSDMEFDMGSKYRKDELEKLWKEKGYTTKIIWWNLNSHNITCPEMDRNGNIFMSGYNPMLLKFLEAGFDGQKFLDKLLVEYEKNIK